MLGCGRRGVASQGGEASETSIESFDPAYKAGLGVCMGLGELGGSWFSLMCPRVHRDRIGGISSYV
jgi:hypothetical protein